MARFFVVFFDNMLGELVSRVFASRGHHRLLCTWLSWSSCSGSVTAWVLFFPPKALQLFQHGWPFGVSLDRASAARITWDIGDTVECHHVDYESESAGHSVNLVDSAAPNGGLNVKTLVGFSLAHVGVMHVDKVELEMSCSGRPKLCALPLMTLPRP